MKNANVVIGVIVSMAVMVVWYYVGEYYRAKYPQLREPVAQQPQATPPATSPAAPPATGATAVAPAAPAATTQAVEMVPARPAVVGAASPQPVVRLGSFALDPTEDPAKEPHEFPLGVELSPEGAGLASVVLNHHRREPKATEPYAFQAPYDRGPAESRRALASRSITVNGQTFDLSSVAWRLESATPAEKPTTAVFSVEVNPPGWDKPLKVTKTFTLRSAEHPGQGYEVAVTHAVENTSSRPANVRLAFNGTNVPQVETIRDIANLIGGYDKDNEGKVVTVDYHAATGLKPAPEGSPLELSSYKGSPALWVGSVSAYFDALVRPAGGPAMSAITAQALDRATNLGRVFVNTTFQTVEFPVAPGATVALPLEVYLGPRSRHVLNAPHYDAFPRNYDETLVLTSTFCAICTWQWLINALVWMLGIFQWAVRDWGLAIIGLVILVRLLLHPVTKSSQVSMSKMSKMAPEMQRLKEKYGDNKEELNKAMMQLYKEQGVTPILGCLPMLLQMPIWIALWSALQSTFELRHAPLLYGWTWIQDLAQPDRIVGFEPVNIFLLSWIVGPVNGLNILPFFLGVVFYFQQKMTPKPENMTPEQEQQFKMMKWMSVLFPLMLYNGPSGLNLYIVTSTLIGIWESKRVRDHIKAREEAEKAGKVLVDARPTRGSKRLKEEQAAAAEARQKKKGGLAGWLADLQERAEELRREKDRKNRGR